MLIRDSSGGFLWDDSEKFSEGELAIAQRMRPKKPSLRPDTGTYDCCPHIEPCANTRVCIEHIAWYMRYWREIEGVA